MISRFCKIHGELNENQIYIQKRIQNNKEYQIKRCAQCMKDAQKKYTSSKKQIIKERNEEYRKNNRERYNMTHRMGALYLKKSYVKKVVKKVYGIKEGDVGMYDQLLDLKKCLIKINRLVKQ